MAKVLSLKNLRICEIFVFEELLLYMFTYHWFCRRCKPLALISISQGVRSQSDFRRKCYLNALRHVIKALAARRLINQRQVFFDVTTSLFVYMVQLWTTHLQAAMEQLSAGNAESAIDALNLACICLKSEDILLQSVHWEELLWTTAVMICVVILFVCLIHLQFYARW